MEAFDRLMELAGRNDIKLNGIAPQLIVGSGAGMVAQRTIKQGEIVVTVPTRTLRTRDTVSKAVSKKLPKDFSAHGLIATEILLDDDPDFADWKAVFPSIADLTAGMPILWPGSLQSLLPASCQHRLEKQKAAFASDWKAVSEAFPELTENDYRYAWLIVNTRGFYNNSAGMKKYTTRDRLALQPVVDLLNHAETGCEVNFGVRTFTVVAEKEYKEGEEVFLSYGPHANDFLFVEYGFVMEQNKWDDVCIDSVLEGLFSPAQKRRLEGRDFWGKYMVDRRTPGCYRAQVALRMLLLGEGRWERVVSGLDEAEDVQKEVDRMLMQAVREYHDVAVETLQVLEEEEEEKSDEKAGTIEQRTLLRRRWMQIESTLMVVEGLLSDGRR